MSQECKKEKKDREIMRWGILIFSLILFAGENLRESFCRSRKLNTSLFSAFGSKLSSIKFLLALILVHALTFSANCTNNQYEIGGNCYERISIWVDSAFSFYDIGDNLTLWANLTNHSLADELWLFTTESINMSYSEVKEAWFCYYTINRKSEVLTVQSFLGTNATGYGEIILTVKPYQRMSWFEEAFKTIGIIFFICIIAAIFFFIFLLGLKIRKVG